MFSLGLTPALQQEYEETLLTSHRVRTTITVRDRDEAPIRDLRPQMLSGEVKVEALADVSRSLTATFLDPTHAMSFDPANPSNSALYADNMLEVKYGVYLTNSQVWVDVPVFFGPITAFSRTGAVVSIEAQGKETLGQAPHFLVSGMTLAKGERVADAIQRVMGRVGETRYQMTGVTGRLPVDRTVIPGEAPWQVCTGKSQDANGDEIPSLASHATNDPFLFYDGAGFLAWKNRTGNAVWAFTEAQLVSRPGFKYDALSFRNHAVVTGGVGEGATWQSRGSYSLPPGHPLSPDALARNGVPRYMSIFAEVEALDTHDQCVARAKRLVEANAEESADAHFNCLPIPHLEELDIVTLETGTYSVTFKAHSFTIPLTPDAPMTVGSGSFPTQRTPSLYR